MGALQGGLGSDDPSADVSKGEGALVRRPAAGIPLPDPDAPR
jgi:hypothetical protein